MINIINKFFKQNVNSEPISTGVIKLNNETQVLKIFKSISNFSNEAELRYVGGCIRKILSNEEVDDIDLATNLKPHEVCEVLKKNNISFYESGIEHGTITAKINDHKFEITSLRKDILTDGRHAKVEFSNDWLEDASRRDFTFNSIYSDINGNLFDPFNGKIDLEKGVVKFIGNAEKRIQEDYLRIFRYYRFLGCFKRINIIDGYEDIIIKHIPKIREYINFDLMRNEILKMLKNKYAINSFIDINKPSDKNYLFKTISDLWNKEKYYLGINKCMNFVDEYF